MVSSVTSTPYYSYLSQLQGSTDTVPSANSTAVTPTSTAGTSPATTSQSLVSSLLSGSTSGNFSSEILSLLQQNSTGSFDPITTLLGGTSTNDGLTSIFANLFASSTASTLTQAQDNGTAQKDATTAATQISSSQNLINQLTQASIAYNQTNLQNIQNVVAANSYDADGVTPLVS